MIVRNVTDLAQTVLQDVALQSGTDQGFERTQATLFIALKKLNVPRNP